MGLGNGMASGSGRKTFRLVLVKPSHYDDDGYVIQWLRSPIPANSLACLYGLAQDASERPRDGAALLRLLDRSGATATVGSFAWDKLVGAR